MIRYTENKHRHITDTAAYSFEQTENVRYFHRMIPDYHPTSLYSLKDVAKQAGVKSVYLKDESSRFGLKSFKGLGGVYAMYRMICRELGLDAKTSTLEMLQSAQYRPEIGKMTFITTTDGNHGKGVSWAAGLFGCKAYVYLPKGTVPVRAEAIRNAGPAEVTVTDMKYDDCVEYTARMAEQNGWFLIQDTAWDGYEEIPFRIMQGYTTLLFEAKEQMNEAPTHLFLQAGVGSMAAAIAASAKELWQNIHIYTVEPTEVACFYDSFRIGDGMPHEATGNGRTIMAGLNCAKPSKTAWNILAGLADGAFSCGDDVTKKGMQILFREPESVIAGESGAVTAGLLMEMKHDMIGMPPDSVVLLINTEGDTDPENWLAVTGTREE